jgi:F-type H+-transporting ATPase subunit delta
MAGTRAAIIKAILDLANSKGVAEAVDTDMKSIVLTISSNEELNIQNPTTRVEEKALLKFC